MGSRTIYILSKLPFQNCQFGISMAAQLVKPKAAIQMCICTQLPSIGTLSDLETTNWFFARPTNTISCQQKPITENPAKKPWKSQLLFSYQGPYFNYVSTFLSIFDQLSTRDRQRFFDRVGHETTYASSGNKHFFIK